MTLPQSPSANRLRFRAWHKKQKRMFDVDAIGNGWVEQHHFGEHGYAKEKIKDRFMFNAVEVMQSTGLTDKNGKEIFEGDILRGTFEMCGDRKNKDKYLGWVEWLDGECLGWALCEPTGHKEIISANSDLRDLVHSITVDFINGEVIGNVWENPDLLPSAQ